MADYKKEEEYAFSKKGKEAFELFGEKEKEETDEKKEEKQDKPCNVKTNKKAEKEAKKKCKKKGKVFRFVTGTVLVGIVVGGIKFGYGLFKDYKEKVKEAELSDKISTWIDTRQSDLDDIVTIGSSANALFSGNYKELYAEYNRLYTVANYVDDMEKMNLEHNIVDRNTSQELCLDCNAENFETQIEALISSFKKLKNTRESQTPGTSEYAEFQNICNTLANTRDAAIDTLNSDKVREVLFEMYGVCLTGDYCDNNKDRNNKPFDVSKIDGIDIQRNSDKTGFSLLFNYDGYQYIKSGVSVTELDAIFTTPDILSRFAIINNILVGNQNNVSKGIVDEVSDDIYNTTGVRISM